MSKMSEKAIDELNRLNDEGKIVITSTPTGNDPIYDIWKKHAGAIRYLAPGEVWTSHVHTEVKEPVTCIHTWHKVTLFTSTVDECSKCGELRD